MKRFLIAAPVAIVLLVGALSLGVAGTSAQGVSGSDDSDGATGGQWSPGVCQAVVDAVQEAAAEVLGIPVGQVQSAQAQGTSLAELAEENGMAVRAFVEQLLPQIRVELAELVEDGTLSERQAVRIFHRIATHIERIVYAHPSPQGPCPPSS